MFYIAFIELDFTVRCTTQTEFHHDYHLVMPSVPVKSSDDKIGTPPWLQIITTYYCNNSSKDRLFVPDEKLCLNDSYRIVSMTIYVLYHTYGVTTVSCWTCIRSMGGN